MDIEVPVSPKRSFRRFFQRIPEYIADVVEHFFYQLGLNIAKQPVRWIFGCVMLLVISFLGLIFFRQEKNPIKLWIPPNSEFLHDTEWLIDQFGEGLRLQTVILTADNVLEPATLLTLNDITKQVISLQSSDHVLWTDVCFKVPVITNVISRKKRAIDITEDEFFDMEPEQGFNKNKFEPAVHIDPKLYCSVINNLPKACVIESILDIWEYDDNILRNVSSQDIVLKLNNVKVSPILGHPMQYTDLLGGVIKDEEGRIISATAVKTKWLVHINFSEVNMDTFGNSAGTADWATSDILSWELSFLDVLEKNAKLLHNQRNENHTLAIWYEAGRSFGDVTEATIFQHLDKLAIGFILMFVYVVAILSDYNWVELRFSLTIVGLACIGGAFLSAVSICSILGIPYGPVHTSLPFLLLSLGVDDNFLIMASWKQIHADKLNRDKPLQERVALMLGNAGSAISITSLTDVVAFVIGASTILPSLQSFCIYAAIGVLLTFILQITFYTAFFTLDTQRIESKRNAIWPCIKHENFTQKFVNPQETFSSKFITNLYSKVVLTLPGKIIIILITIAMITAGVMGALQLQVWFDPKWFLGTDTYLNKFFEMQRHHYPDQGYEAKILLGDIDYPTEFPNILNLTERFENLPTVRSIEPWPIHFAKFVSVYYQKDLRKTTLNDEQFRYYLSKFLFSRSGGKYQGNFRFDGKLECGQDTPRISIATIDLTFKRFYGPHEWIPAMDESKQIVKEAGIDGFATIWCKQFSFWVTDKLLGQEVQRNLLLALVCVMGMTGLLIAEPQTCFWILLCVLLTLLNVCGFMVFLGLTIDVTSCIALELAIGLSVDYAAHVAHAFVHAASEVGHQDRIKRAHIAVRYIGAAVAYGAGSTLLALSSMTLAGSYVFNSFFKIFVLVIFFGIWHGLFLLPVILSTIGPRSIRPRKREDSHEATDETFNEAARPLNKETVN